MHKSIKTLLLVPAVILSAACSKDKAADAALSNDLTLAAQARQTATLDSITAAERTRAASAASLRTASPAPQSTARRASTTHRSTSSGGTMAASEPRTVTEKNTNRDAAIGAAAGAIIGATTSRDKLKGGLIGAAAGGILGGVIGNNVDIKKKKVP
ncbi:MAG: YMGG-like glycine zipper-containing protein [bacterium]